jgi:hypothetical protein
MIRDDTLYGVIQEIVRKETVFLKHYTGQVLNNTDDTGIGSLIVSVPSLNIVLPKDGFRAAPRDKQSMNVPAVGDWVEIYFLEGDPDMPVYIGSAPEVGLKTPLKTFDGQPSTHVIFESPKTQESIIYDDTKKTLNLLQGDEPFVLGNAIMTEHAKTKDILTQLLTIINGAPIPEAGAGANSAFQAALTAVLATLSAPDYGSDQLSKIITGK